MSSSESNFTGFFLGSLNLAKILKSPRGEFLNESDVGGGGGGFDTKTLLRTLTLLLRSVQPLKLLPRVDMTSHFLHPRAGEKPHSNGPRADK